MNNQTIKNLNELDDFQVLVRTERASTVGTRNTQSLIRNATLSNTHEIEYNEEDFGTLNLNRRVIIKSYAPKTFRRIRELSKVSDEDLLNSLEPSKNIK